MLLSQRTQILDIDLQRWSPVRVRAIGCHQFTTSSNSTTLESNMSQVKKAYRMFSTKDQQLFWNEWNATAVEGRAVGHASVKRGEIVLRLFDSLRLNTQN